jgi:hypothetical protein
VRETETKAAERGAASEASPAAGPGESANLDYDAPRLDYDGSGDGDGDDDPQDDGDGPSARANPAPAAAPAAAAAQTWSSNFAHVKGNTNSSRDPEMTKFLRKKSVRVESALLQLSRRSRTYSCV